MNKIFTKEYAQFYDLFYRTKNYTKECLYLETLWKKFSKKRPKSVLDIACGTGGHANVLAKRGYRVVGIDRSIMMLRRAQEKARKLNVSVSYRQASFETMQCKQKFDAAISMFSAVDYITNYEELMVFLKRVRKVLKKGGLFIFDVWNGVAVLKYFIPEKRRVFRSRRFEIIRSSRSFIYPIESLLRVNHCVEVKDYLTKKTRLHVESHLLRFFFIKELELLLECTGFSTVSIHPFMRMDAAIKQNDWDITVVAQAR